MSLKYVLPNAPSLITSIGVLFGLNFIYNTPLSSNTFIHSFIFSHNITYTPFTTKSRNKITIINVTIYGRTSIIDDSKKIFLVQR